MRLLCQGWLNCSVRRRSQWQGCSCTVSRICADCCTTVSGRYGARKPTCRVQSFLRTPEAFWAATVEGGNGCDLLCAGLILTRTGLDPLCLLFHFLCEVTTHAEPQHLMCAGVVNLACMCAVCIEYVILRYPLVLTPSQSWMPVVSCVSFGALRDKVNRGFNAWSMLVDAHLYCVGSYP